MEFRESFHGIPGLLHGIIWSSMETPWSSGMEASFNLMEASINVTWNYVEFYGIPWTSLAGVPSRLH